MKYLKNIIILLTAIITLVMMAATMIEASKGTPFVQTNIYTSPWFVALWGVLAVGSGIYIIGKKLYVRLAVFMVHAAFVVILLGAFTSWLTAESGDIHLRAGESTSAMRLTDGMKKDLGFQIKLNRFRVVYYPGTDAPMDYVSEIVADGEPMQVSMNNIGQRHGYRFTQAGYDSDMQGTRFGVAYDPWGISITYAGYALLFASLLWMLFSKKTQMRTYYRRALGSQTFKAAFLLLALISTLTANAQERIKMDKQLADDFGRICVLYNSRICPINTVATNFVTKLSGKPSWGGLSANEIFMGWVFDVADWEQVRMIEVKDKEIQRMLGIPDKWAAFTDFYNEYNEYKLEKRLNEATQQGDLKMQKRLREVDEKFNVIRMLYGGELLRMFPYTDKQGKMTWLAPGEKNVHGNLPAKEWYFVRKVMDLLAEAVISGDKDRASLLIGKIYDYQHIRGEAAIPSTPMVYAEVAYTTVNSQHWPIILFLALSLCLVVAAQAMSRRQALVSKTYKALMAAMLLYTTLLLALRWAISGHLPLSNGYETMQFMAWAVLNLTVFARRKFAILGHFGLLLASFALLVAMITDGNPQITQLMPVLQSPLLSVHVMVIMFSYALFGLMALIGIEGLVAHYRKAPEREEQLASLASLLLYPAIALLAIGIFIGAIWANVSWGRYWGWDSKEVWALITMLVYSAPLHDIRWLQSPLRRNAYFLVAFLTVLMTYFGVNYFLAGMHSYA